MKYVKQKFLPFLLVLLAILIIINAAAAAVLIFKIKNSDNSDNINNIDNIDDSEVIYLKSNNIPPKYIFLFIGDGMGYAQIKLAEQYKISVKKELPENGNNLAMLNFDVNGIASTNNASTIIGESAASATAMASGVKTYGSYLNYDVDGNRTETISEKLKKQLDFKIGVISSVNINHATPAAFYAHQNSRYNNGSIFLELLGSEFDFFGGGSILSVKSAEEQSGKPLSQLLSENGYLIIKDEKDILDLNNPENKIIAVAPKTDAYGTIPYAIDKEPDSFTIADFTGKCIELLYGDKGFFIMVEGGKIDWCGHANDAATMIYEVIDFDDAIKEAVKFYDKYPDETLIIVTGDHETGGLSLGYSATYTSTYLQYLARQKLSYSEFSRKVYSYRQNQTSFEDILPDIYECFGIAPYDGTDNFYLNTEDIEKLRAAYEQSLTEPSMRNFGMTEYVSYGFYDPLTSTITGITNKKAGVTWGTFSHTFAAVPVFAVGNGAELFGGAYHNSEIFHKLKSLLDLD